MTTPSWLTIPPISPLSRHSTTTALVCYHTTRTRGGGEWSSPWITTMSSGHDVSEYELGDSGLPRVHVSPQQPWKNWLKIDKNHDSCKNKKTLGVVWCTQETLSKTLSHTPFPTLDLHQNTDKTSSWGNSILVLLEIKNTTPNILPEKKRHGGVNHLLRDARDTWGLFGKET